MKCVEGIAADAERARELMDRSTAVATALSPRIGYAATADIAKEAVRTGKSIRQIAKEREVLTDAELDTLLDPERMTTPMTTPDKT
jgi:aspartate ammonia-lyase